MMTRKQMDEFIARKIPESISSDLIDELISIAYNRAIPTMVRDYKGNPIIGDNGPIIEDLKPHTTSNQIAAIKMITEYSIGKPQAVEAEPVEAPTAKSGVVVILPSNGR